MSEMGPIHVYPTDDLIEHDTDDDACVCGPTPSPVERDDGSFGWLLVHNALDGREHREPCHDKAGCGVCGTRPEQVVGRLCDDDDSHWPEPGPSGVEPPSSIEVDLPDVDEQVLYGPDGSVLLVMTRPFGFAAWRDR